MICESLPNTGAAVRPDLLLLVAIACLVIGAVIVVAARRRGRRRTTVALLLLVGAAMAVTAGAPTPAMADGCLSTSNSLTVVQTSVMTGMAPGIAPVDIDGIVSNRGSDSTYIDVVDVEIASVSTDPAARPGTCDATDYLLIDRRMPVGRTLEPGGSAPFTGASIGFSNKSSNQDVCKGATVHLRYVANPG